MSDAGFEALLEFLKRARGFDFTGYKRASLERRFRRRLDAVSCAGYGDYLDYLEVHPEEFEQLFDTLLINVTTFFRDPPAWQVLREEVLPELLARRNDGGPLRVWSAGCASGQEAFSIAMSLAELLGPEAYRERVKIYGTDIDEDALAYARAAVYTAKELVDVPEHLRERYFERAGTRYAFRHDLRRTVIFGRNNLVEDAPISRLDLLLCRNTLIYFTAETQARILRHFQYALGADGTLMLGKSEMMPSQRDAFTPIDVNQRIFRRNPLTSPSQARTAAPADGDQVDPALGDDERVTREAALEVAPHPQVIVSRAGLVTFVNLMARTVFGISIDQLGRPFAELELSYHPVDLRAPVEEALRERRRVAVGEVAHTPERGQTRYLDVDVRPLLPDGGAAVGALITFEDVSRYAALQHELEGNRRDLELAYEELQSTIDELETTNEELQSANEELRTTNEELQSTNEELETMNEELQATNEELETILSSLGLAVAVVDPNQRIQEWNQRAEDLWGLRHDEAVDHHLLTLDIGLPTEQLGPALRAALTGGERQDLELEAVNRRGRSIVCRTTVMPLVDPHESAEQRLRGAIVLMDDQPADTDGQGS